MGGRSFEGGEAASGGLSEGGIAERVLADDLEVLDAVQYEVHAGNGCGGEILALSEDLAVERTRVAVCALHVLDRAEQHSASAAGRAAQLAATTRSRPTTGEARFS